MDFSRRCPRFHHANSRPTLSRLQRARRKNLYLSLEYTTFCLKKQVKKTISMKVRNFVTFPVHSRFKFGADVLLFPNGDIAHARRLLPRSAVFALQHVDCNGGDCHVDHDPLKSEHVVICAPHSVHSKHLTRRLLTPARRWGFPTPASSGASGCHTAGRAFLPVRCWRLRARSENTTQRA